MDTIRIRITSYNVCYTKLLRYEPKGHIYIRNVEFSEIPKITYRVGNIIFSKERLLVEKEEQVLIRYTLEEAQERNNFV